MLHNKARPNLDEIAPELIQAPLSNLFFIAALISANNRGPSRLHIVPSAVSETSVTNGFIRKHNGMGWVGCIRSGRPARRLAPRRRTAAPRAFWLRSADQTWRTTHLPREPSTTLRKFSALSDDRPITFGTETLMLGANLLLYWSWLHSQHIQRLHFQPKIVKTNGAKHKVPMLVNKYRITCLGGKNIF